MKCDRCSNEATHINEIDPYEADVGDNKRRSNLCNDCWQNCIDDI